MSPSEIREMNDAELVEALGEAKRERFNLRFQLATNQFDNNSRLKVVKRDIARILTIMREREAAAGVAMEEQDDE